MSYKDATVLLLPNSAFLLDKEKVREARLEQKQWRGKRDFPTCLLLGIEYQHLTAPSPHSLQGEQTSSILQPFEEMGILFSSLFFKTEQLVLSED